MTIAELTDRIFAGGDKIVLFRIGVTDPIIEDVVGTPSLGAVKELVSGYVETVDWWSTGTGVPVQVYCNEDGRALGLPINIKASTWLVSLRAKWSREPALVGPVVVLVGHKAVWK